MLIRSDDGIVWMVQNVDPCKIGQRVGLYVDPDDIQIMRRSELSPEFGSYGIKKPAEDVPESETAGGSSGTQEAGE